MRRLVERRVERHHTELLGALPARRWGGHGVTAAPCRGRRGAKGAKGAKGARATVDWSLGDAGRFERLPPPLPFGPFEQLVDELPRERRALRRAHWSQRLAAAAPAPAATAPAPASCGPTSGGGGGGDFQGEGLLPEELTGGVEGRLVRQHPPLLRALVCPRALLPREGRDARLKQAVQPARRASRSAHPRRRLRLGRDGRRDERPRDVAAFGDHGEERAPALHHEAAAARRDGDGVVGGRRAREGVELPRKHAQA